MKEIYLHAWRLFRQNFFKLLVITLVVWIPCSIAVSWMSYHLFSPDNIMASIRLNAYASSLFGIIAVAASFYIFREKEAGRPSSLSGAFATGFSYWGWMFATGFIVNVGIGVGLVLLILPGIYLFVRLGLCQVIVVAEDHWAFDAIRRNVQLTEGKFWKTFVWLVGGCFPCFLAAALVTIPFSIFDESSWGLDATSGVFSSLPIMFINPILWAIYTKLRDEQASPSLAPSITPKLG